MTDRSPALDQVLRCQSNTSAVVSPVPPATRTFPLLGSSADTAQECPTAGFLDDAQCPEPGSKTSAVCALTPASPTTRTRPSGKRLLEARIRLECMLSADDQDPVAGSYISTVAWGGGTAGCREFKSPDAPPMTRTRPSASRIAPRPFARTGTQP